MTRRDDVPVSGELSLVGIAVVLLRRRRTIALVTLLAVTLAVTSGLLARRTYTASAALMPQSADARLSRLAGLAAQFGVPTLGSQGGQSPDFYASLLTSRQLLGAVADSPLTVPAGAGTRRASLADLLLIGNEAPEIRRERAIDALRERVGAVADAKTGMVEVTARMPDPALSQQVVQRMIELLNEFNLRTRQSQARAERVFVEGRLQEVEAELRQAENRLQTFLQRNRDYSNAPQLRFEHDRLQQDVQMRRQVRTGLVQSYEQSRIDEVRDTPVITLVTEVTRPVEPDPRRLVTRAVVGMLLGGMLGVLLGFIREFARGRRESGDATFQDLIALRRQTWEDVKRPWRLLRPAGEAR
jgi:uncharacterized protein involved in exopolysaccharide biosynthesis